jgi:uncharacterized membrane protein
VDRTSEESGSAEMLRSLQQLEERIARIEAHLGLSSEQKEFSNVPVEKQAQQESLETDEALENQIGETLFARVGILVLAIGVAFLLTFPLHSVPPVLPSLFGYVLVIGASWLSARWRDSLPQLSRYILAGALLLLYFTTLRLFFFSADAALENKNVELVLLLLVVVASTIISARRGSPYLTIISLMAGYTTALIGGNGPFVFLLCAALALGAVLLTRQYGWYAVLLFATALTYSTHMIWALGNPVMGNAIHLVTPSPASSSFVLLYVLLLAGGTLLRPSGVPEEGAIAVAPFVNGLLGYGLYTLITLPEPGTSLSTYHLGASVILLLLSILYWLRERSRFATFVYAMLGYMALSVAIVAAFPGPDYFVWLACQSILVISTAVWFRSRFIIGTNFVIYIMLFVAYLFLAGTVSLISIIFGLVALLSARILNWRKDRLELKTDMMRNAYLASAFFIIPYALYHTLPAAYVSISWVAVALFYFVMSVLLRNNRKYRWMALLTLCLTIGYVFVVDIRNLEPAYRILSFLVLGIALFWISVLYARKRTRAQSSRQERSQPDQFRQHIHEP